MRSYWPPLLVCTLAGVGILVVVLLNRDEDPIGPITPPPPDRGGDHAAVKEDRWGKKRDTLVTPEEFTELSELERALQRKDKHGLDFYAGRMCEKAGKLNSSDKYREVVLGLIREHAADGDDPRIRDALFQILRVMEGPEATQMIIDEFYRARSHQERMVLLDAMSRPYHRPELASTHAVDIALNTPRLDQRELAFTMFRDNSTDLDLTFETARKIYEGTTTPQQGRHMLEEISSIANRSGRARAWARKMMMSTTRMDELPKILGNIPNWGDLKDADRLESLAITYPALSVFLQDAAETLRYKARAEAGDDEALRRMEEEKARRAKEAEEAHRAKESQKHE